MPLKRQIANSSLFLLFMTTSSERTFSFESSVMRFSMLGFGTDGECQRKDNLSDGSADRECSCVYFQADQMWTGCQMYQSI